MGTMGGKKNKNVPVYSKDRKKILGYVDQRATSVGAAKEVGAKSCSQEKVNGTYAWIVKEGTSSMKNRMIELNEMLNEYNGTKNKDMVEDLDKISLVLNNMSSKLKKLGATHDADLLKQAVKIVGMVHSHVSFDNMR